MKESKIMIVADVRSYEQTVIFDAWDEVFRQKKLQKDQVKVNDTEIIEYPINSHVLFTPSMGRSKASIDRT